jgi:hypothetical protein
MSFYYRFGVTDKMAGLGFKGELIFDFHNSLEFVLKGLVK